MNAERLELFHRFGSDPISYTGLQPGMDFFQTSYGYLAYRLVGKTAVTLGSPVCAAGDEAQLLQSFLRIHKNPVFCYSGAGLAAKLNNHGFYSACMGVERIADCRSLLEIPAKPVKGAVKKAAKRGFAVTPIKLDDLGRQQIERLQQISRRYLRRSQCDFELRFMNRPMAYRSDGLRRCFTLHKYDDEHDGIFGFVALNPYYSGGVLKGYMLDVIRFEKTRLWGVWFSTLREIAALLQDEGLELSLGYCILQDTGHYPGNSSWLNTQIRWAARLLASSQYVRQLGFLKSHIQGHNLPRFFCTRRRSILKPFYCLWRASGLELGYLFGPELLRSMRSGIGGGRRTVPGEAGGNHVIR